MTDTPLNSFDVNTTETVKSEEPVTIFNILKQSTINEVCSPEILPYKSSIVRHFLAQIEKREQLRDEISSVGDKELNDFYEMDTERIKYYIRLYIRTRLLKIEKYHDVILSKNHLVSRLSEEEKVFAQRYRDAFREHVEVTFLNELPESMRGYGPSSKSDNMVNIPNLNNHVFCKVIDEIGAVTIEGTDTVISLEKGNTYVLKYKIIRPFLLDGRANLI